MPTTLKYYAPIKNSAVKCVIRVMTAVFFVLIPLLSAGRSSSDNELRLKTVVIDAGHGGKDAGAISKDKKTYEKNVTLSIALLLGKKIEEACPDVKVVYTRTSDVFVELNERAAIANRNKADLFISVHINSNNSASPDGFSAHILGQSSQANRDLFSANMELSKRENSVILLEEDYDTKYQGYDPSDPESMIFFNLLQNAHYEQSILFAADVCEALNGGPLKRNRGISQNPFLVLWKTTMPAVLLELGFISNDADLKVLSSSSGREDIADRLLAAFKAFKDSYDGSVDYMSGGSAAASNSGQASAAATAQGASVTSRTDAGVRYGIQIMTLSRRLDAGDPALKGYSAEIFQSGNIYRYVVEVSDNEKRTRGKISSVREKFSDAYLVKIENGVPTKID